MMMIMWAPNDGAAKRAHLMRIEEDVNQIPAEAPSELLPVVSGKTYGEIVQELKGRNERFLEHASYRIASDGAFVHRAISTERIEILFRSVEDEDSELPYAITYRLS
jgi:hypothetical protein